jgi:hypothetical protein
MPAVNSQTFYKWAAIVFGAIIALYVVIELVGGDEAASEKPNFPAGGPAQFLYLDGAQTDAYLAQVDGGSYDSEKVTRKASDTLGGKLTVAGLGEASGTRAKELFVERVLQPTDASNFFALKSGLDDQGDIEPISLRNFEEGVGQLEEGRFVSFKSSALLSPIYLNAYLAVRQANSLEAIFPRSQGRREASRKFFDEVGKDPRAVFVIQPTRADNPQRKEPFVYLMPIGTRNLTAERSLTKYGGGSFTVVGKMVRRFPERFRDHHPAYIDSATLETWEHPLRKAPGELLCRTEPRCITRVRRERLRGPDREGAIRSARRRILTALREQTEIGKLGAVILPIAIYK